MFTVQLTEKKTEIKLYLCNLLVKMHWKGVTGAANRQKETDRNVNGIVFN